MPKAGKYDYPTKDLDYCLAYLTKAYDTTKEHSMTRETFADAIKMSSKGGGFGVLVGSIGQYKLASTGDGYVRYTDIAQKLLHGEPNEQEIAKSEAVLSVRLFADIFDQFGSNPTEDQLRIFLREKAIVEMADAGKIAVEVGRLFNKVAGYIKSTNESGGENKEVLEQVHQTNSLVETYKLGEGIEIKLPKENTEDAWDRAQRALNIILGVDKISSNQLKGEKDSNPPT